MLLFAKRKKKLSYENVTFDQPISPEVMDDNCEIYSSSVPLTNLLYIYHHFYGVCVHKALLSGRSRCCVLLRKRG